MGFFDRFKRKADDSSPTQSPNNPAPSKPQLKERYMELDIAWPVEQLQPYYDEALFVLSNGCDNVSFWWGAHTLHELYRIENPVFRSRIAQDVAGNLPVVEMLTSLHLDSIRYQIKRDEAWAIVQENLYALNGKPMQQEMDKAAQSNQVWVTLADKFGQFIRPQTVSQRKALQTEICSLCSQLDSCSAADKLVNRTVELMQAVNRQQSQGGDIWTQSVNLQTGQRSEVTESPTLQDVERLGVDMLASLSRPLLDACREGRDYSIDPERDGGNYKVMLDMAFQKLS